MKNRTQWIISWITAAAAVTVLGCSKEEPKVEPPAVKSVAKPMPSAPPPEPAKPPAPTTPPVDCPAGSKGEGTMNSPCEATGDSRMMDVVWTGKIDDKGPLFKVTNKSKSVILYGKIAVYFYDKAGKQLDVPPKSGGDSDKARPYHTCSGNMFGGVMKAGEKAVLTFSCVKAERVPEGTKAIEAEMQMVGFTDASEKTVEYYWRNNDLTPDTRKKGGKK